MVSLGEIAKHYAYEYVCVKVCVLYLDICMKIDLSLCPPHLSIYISLGGKVILVNVSNFLLLLCMMFILNFQVLSQCCYISF